jgi:16S rRNA (uracil1498-N3)-methyltransferase
MHRFYIEKDLNNSNIRLDDPEFFNQAHNVLHLRNGEEVILFNGDGSEVVAKITGYGKNSVSLEVVKVFKNMNEPEKHVVLYCAILKKENFELVVQKAVEVGVKEMIPIISKRTVKLNLRMDRLERIAREAAEQSGRPRVPKIHELMEWDEAVEHSKQNEANFLFHLDGPEFSGHDKNKAGIWIGPEGGWSEEEIKKARDSGFQVVSLGRLTLRAETAAVVASHLAVR